MSNTVAFKLKIGGKFHNTKIKKIKYSVISLDESLRIALRTINT